jgi:hypothetical protein
MPWSKKQMRTAQAVEHGWNPKGSAKGFTKGFADQVISEGVKREPDRKKLRKHFTIQSTK